MALACCPARSMLTSALTGSRSLFPTRRVYIHAVPSGATANEDVSAALLRTALEPVDVVDVHRDITEPEALRGQDLGRHRGRPCAVARTGHERHSDVHIATV